MCEQGINVSLQSFIGVSQEHLQKFSEKRGENIFVNIKKRKRPVEENAADPSEAKTTGEAIKMMSQTIEFDQELSLVVVTPGAGSPSTTIPIVEGTPLPSKIRKAVDEVVKAEDRNELALLDNFEEERKVSKWADSIELLPVQRKLSPDPKSWKCDNTGDSIETTSLWLNLSDGFVGGGRKYFDGTGGNNTAVDHYDDMKKEGKNYPLAVKLGTITPEGADVYSYEEDDMVLVPKLAEYLAHHGIDVMKMEKTEKSMQELELDKNRDPNLFRAVLDDGKPRIPVHGPGLTGMINLGNSCYMNSVMQCVFTVPEFQESFAQKSEEIYEGVKGNPAEDFRAQLAKVGQGLLSGQYSEEGAPDERDGIRPNLFKKAVGAGHAEFGGPKQQDAQEFLGHLLTKVEREQHAAGCSNPGSVFKFKSEERLECDASHTVRYKELDDDMLRLAIPLEAATNTAEVAAWEKKKQDLEAAGEKPNMDEAVVPEVPMAALIESWGSNGHITDWKSPVTNEKGTATSSTRFLTFPKWLFVQLRREAIGADWVPKKLDCTVPMGDLDIEHLRKAAGIQEGEKAMPEGAAAAAAAAPTACDESTVNDLVNMGFPAEACKKAVIKTGNVGSEAAMEWIMMHMEDPDFNEPFEAAPAAGDASPVDQASVEMLMSMGFTQKQCEKALRNTGGDVERATDWIFSHPDDDGSEDAAPANSTAAPAEDPASQDGPGKYELMGFITHMGKSMTCGHYVCHIKKDGKWVLFNDEKVCAFESPPLGHGYLYLYRRRDA